MGKIRFYKLLGIFFLLFIFILGGCNLVNKTSTSSNKANKEETVNIKFMSNLPNRTGGQGKIEQLLADRYMEEHPNIKITFETFQDDAFQHKFNAYASLNNIPDIFMAWADSQFDLPSKVAAELNMEDFKKYGFIPGALESRMRNGKLYGIPKNNDMYWLYYNKSIFEKNNIKIPTTFQELISVVKILKSKNIIPCATNGKDKWELAGLFGEIYYLVNPSPQKFFDNWDNASFGKDPSALEAAGYFKQLIDAGFFQKSYMTTDYGTARSLFTSGKAAMYYMGSWEYSMATDKDLPKEFKDNLSIMQLPHIEGRGQGKNVLYNWYGGSYSVGKDSPVKKEAIEFLKYMFKPDNWARLCWENGVCIAPQIVDRKESNIELMNSVNALLKNIDVYQGNYRKKKSIGSYGTGNWDTVSDLAVGKLSPEKFVAELDHGIIEGLSE